MFPFFIHIYWHIQTFLSHSYITSLWPKKEEIINHKSFSYEEYEIWGKGFCSTLVWNQILYFYIFIFSFFLPALSYFYFCPLHLRSLLLLLRCLRLDDFVACEMMKEYKFVWKFIYKYIRHCEKAQIKRCSKMTLKFITLNWMRMVREREDLWVFICEHFVRKCFTVGISCNIDAWTPEE